MKRSADVSASADQQDTVAITKGNLSPEPKNSPPGREITLAELLKTFEDTPEDQPTFPCSLDVALNDKIGLQKFRRRWLNTEDDSRYVLETSLDAVAPLGVWSNSCVCPSICVLVLKDKMGTEPNNHDILIIDRKSPERGHIWAVKGIDLSDARLTWASSTPYFEFGLTDGQPQARCAVLGDKKGNYSCVLYPDKRDLFAKTE
jgi:hypothetical protein